MERNRAGLVPISKESIKQFCKVNHITITELADVAGYASQGGFSRVINKGYIQAEALSNLYQFFDLPRGYFNGPHEEPLQKKEEPNPIEAHIEVPAPVEVLAVVLSDEAKEKAIALKKAYGYVSYNDLFNAAIHTLYDNYCTKVMDRYKNLSKDELIAELVDRDLKGA